MRFDDAFLVSAPIRWMAAWGCFWPSFGLFGSALLSLVRGNYAAALATHCHNAQFLPSLSALIAIYPEKQLWQFSMCMLLSLVLFTCAMLHEYLRRHLASNVYSFSMRAALFVCTSAHVVEWLFLALLSFVTSDDSMMWHQLGFIGFILCHWVHSGMLLALQMHMLRHGGAQLPSLGSIVLSATATDSTSKDCAVAFSLRTLQLRARIICVNIVSFALAAVFYLVHTAHCTPYFYSYFAVCEWFVILLVILFHCVMALDLDGSRLAFVLTPDALQSLTTRDAATHGGAAIEIEPLMHR